tara:strand:- start:5486 stop:5887 length:402 start_codon:yes stop_codon:yes gene_type:complete
MAAIITRLSIRSKNLFANALSARHDKVTAVGTDADRRIKTIKEASGAPAVLIDASDYHSAGTETVFVFIKNTTTTASKYIYIKIGSQIVCKLKPGAYILFPWYVTSASLDVNVYSNDASAGVKVEYFAVLETT